MILAPFRPLIVALLALWPLIPCAAAERGTRVFVVEDGVFSVTELQQVFAAYPERENTLYFGTYDGLQVRESANAADALAASDAPASNDRPPTSEKLSHIAARAINAAAQYYRLKEPGANSSSEEKAELGRVEFVVLLAHFNTAEQPVSEAETDACAWKESRSARSEIATHRDLPLRIDVFRLHIETNTQKFIPRVLARAVAISLGALRDDASQEIELIETGCPEESTPIDLDPVDLSVACPPSAEERTTKVPASTTTSLPLARPVCNTPFGLAVGQQPPPNPPPPATPALPSPPVAAPTGTTAQTDPVSNPPNQVAALPPTPAPPPPPQPALPPAEATIPAPEAGFAFQTTVATASANTLADVAVISQSSNSQAVLWLAPLDLGGVPDPAAMTSATARWIVTPGDRYELGRTQRVFLLITPAVACQAGETLWAKVSLDGAWLAPGEAGQRTLGGKIVDCDKPAIVQELLSVTQKDWQ